MRIGFTYDLKSDYLEKGYSKEQVAEFDSPITISAIINVIESMGHTVIPIGNFFSLSDRLADGERWDMVFNICEGMYGSGREALVPAMLDAYQIPYAFSEPLVHTVTLNKAITKQLLAAHGLPVTEFALIISADDTPSLSAPFPHFVKVVSEGTGKGITPACIVHNVQAQAQQIALLLAEFKQPVIVEPFLSGREVTVGVLGTGRDAFCIGVMEVGFTDKADSNIHSYYNKENCESAAVYTMANDNFAKCCSDISVAAHRVLNIKDASRIDIRADDNGNPQIMEINSLPGLMPERSDLILLADRAGLSYHYVIETIVNSAIARLA